MILEHSHWDSVSLFFVAIHSCCNEARFPTLFNHSHVPATLWRALTSSFIISHISYCYYLVHPFKHAGIKELLLMYLVTSFQGHAPWLNCSSSHKHFLLHLCRTTLVLLSCEHLLHPLLRFSLNWPTWSYLGFPQSVFHSVPMALPSP